MRIHQSDRPDDDICLLFGRNPGHMDRVAGEPLDTRAATPARLAIYDAPLDAASITAAALSRLAVWKRFDPARAQQAILDLGLNPSAIDPSVA